METIIVVVHVLLALTLVGTVLLQRSEGGALGMGGGGGGGGGLITSRSAANLLTRLTAILAAGFMITSLTLTIMARNTTGPQSVMDADTAPAPVEAEEPAEPAEPVVPLPDD